MIAALALAGGTAHAIDNTRGAREAGTERYRMARAVIATPGMTRTMEALIDPETLAAQAVALYPQLDEAEVDRIASVLAERMTEIMPAMRKAFVASAAETFTLDELAAMRRYHESDQAASIAEKSDDYVQGALRRVGPALRALQGAIVADVVRAMR